MIIGSPGSGKSTFARRLRDKTGLPLFYLDMIWHKADRTNVTKEEFDRRMSEIVAGDEWIIDGNYSRTAEIRLRECDTVFLFDLPVEECIAGVESRIGRKREEMPWIEEAFDEEFRQYILDFPEKSLPTLRELLGKYGGTVRVTVFRTRHEADDFIENIKK